MKTYVNAEGKKFTPSSNAFEFVQKDKKITDIKFESKPTTFIVDAFKRFCKNKSSVAGAIIIGIIILLSLIVPVTSKYDIEKVHSHETMMYPKLFDAGFGFWDGTKEIKDQPYDANGIPFGYTEDSISNITYYKNENGSSVCSFTYDIYQDKYGTKTGKVSQIDMMKYIENGYCSMDLNDYTTFEILDAEKCPIIEVHSNVDDIHFYECTVCYYKYYGYSSMPKFLFGTDKLGRDLTTSCFSALRYSLSFAVVLSLFCFTFGLIWGSISGYFGGTVDLALERFMEILGSVPGVCIVTLLRLNLGEDLWVFALAMAITGWMSTAGTTRTQFYRFKGREYVLACRTLGSKDGRLIFKHILPNALGTIITSSAFMIPNFILTESAYSYLGLGLKGVNSFGTILANNQGYLQTYPMLIIFPAIIISLFMISFNLFANGLRDAVNPSLKGSD